MITYEQIIESFSDLTGEISLLKQTQKKYENIIEKLFEISIKKSRLCKVLYKSDNPNDFIEWRETNNLVNFSQLQIQNYMDQIYQINHEIKEIKRFLSNNFNKEWQGGVGKHPGEIIDTPDGCRIRFDEQSRSFKFKNYNRSHTTIVCKSKEDCLNQAKKYLYDYYNNLEKVSNQYRFVHPKYIQVKLPSGQTFLTDSKFIDIIEQNKISDKHDKKNEIHYVVYLSNYREHTSFYKLITKYSKINYKNGCTLDLRLENLQESDNELLLKLNSNGETKIKSENLRLNKDGYPYDQWILGKYAGTVFQRSGRNTWSVVVKKDDGSVVTKTYKFNEDNKQEIYEKSITVRNQLSDQYNLTKNRIKIISDDIILVELTKNQTMQTEYKFLDKILKYPLYATKSSDLNSKYYAEIDIKGKKHKYHKYITGFDMVDHIDRNPLNNCLENLRECNHKINNNNRSKSESSKAIVLGVTFSEKDEAFKARIKQNGVEVSKQFSIKKYGYEMAKQLAIEARENYNLIYSCSNG